MQGKRILASGHLRPSINETNNIKCPSVTSIDILLTFSKAD